MSGFEGASYELFMELDACAASVFEVNVLRSPNIEAQDFYQSKCC
jgi:hypothetical protein